MEERRSFRSDRRVIVLILLALCVSDRTDGFRTASVSLHSGKGIVSNSKMLSLSSNKKSGLNLKKHSITPLLPMPLTVQRQREEVRVRENVKALALLSPAHAETLSFLHDPTVSAVTSRLTPSRIVFLVLIGMSIVRAIWRAFVRFRHRGTEKGRVRGTEERAFTKKSSPPWAMPVEREKARYNAEHISDSERAREATLGERGTDDRGHSQLISAIEDRRIGEAPPVQRRILAKRKAWREKHDPTLDSDRAAELFEGNPLRQLAEGEREIERVLKARAAGQTVEAELVPHSLSTELDRERASMYGESDFSDANEEVVVTDAPTESLLPATPSLSSAVPPSPSPSKKSSSWFDVRSLFSRSPSVSRPTDLATALGEREGQVEGERDFRSEVAVSLDRLLSLSLSTEGESAEYLSAPQGVPEVSVVSDREGERDLNAVVERLRSAWKSLSPSLSEAQAAEAFADVANVFLVSLLDQCVRATESDIVPRERDGERESADAVEARKLALVDALLSYLERVDAVFHSLCPSSTESDGQSNAQTDGLTLVYNGHTRRSRLDALFELYAMACVKASNGGPLGRMLGGAVGGGQGPGGLDVDALLSMATGRLSGRERERRLSMLQKVLSVSASRRTNVEQRLSRSLMMQTVKGVLSGGLKALKGDKSGGTDALAALLGGAGGAGGLGALAGALGGSGGASGGLGDPQKMEEMMKQMLGGGGTGGGGLGAMLQEAMKAMQQSGGKGGLPGLEGLPMPSEDEMRAAMQALQSPGAMEDLMKSLRQGGGPPMGRGGIPGLEGMPMPSEDEMRAAMKALQSPGAMEDLMKSLGGPMGKGETPGMPPNMDMEALMKSVQNMDPSTIQNAMEESMKSVSECMSVC